MKYYIIYRGRRVLTQSIQIYRIGECIIIVIYGFLKIPLHERVEGGGNKELYTRRVSCGCTRISYIVTASEKKLYLSIHIRYTYYTYIR